MGKVVAFKRPSPRKRADGLTLCKSGFHRWQILAGTPFDPKLGKLVTRSRCTRCGVEKSEAR